MTLESLIPYILSSVCGVIKGSGEDDKPECSARRLRFLGRLMHLLRSIPLTLVVVRIRMVDGGCSTRDMCHGEEDTKTLAR